MAESPESAVRRPVPVVVGIGEVLWDLLPSGKVAGGAPANFAYHARCLGADARLISRVGDDGSGREIVAWLAGLGLDTSAVTTDRDHPTGTVDVTVSETGQPAYEISDGAAWDTIEAGEAAFGAVRQADALAFGSLAQRSPVSRESIAALVSAAPAGALRVFDINLRPPHVDLGVIESSLAMANALKLNDDELPYLVEAFGLPDPRSAGGDGQRVALAAAVKRFGLQLLALTRGAEGSVVFSRGEWSDLPGEPVEGAVDTVGAGDSFTAALVMGWLDGRRADEINRSAAMLARHVCQHRGATPPLDDKLRDQVLGGRRRRRHEPVSSPR